MKSTPKEEQKMCLIGHKTLFPPLWPGLAITSELTESNCFASSLSANFVSLLSSSIWYWWLILDGVCNAEGCFYIWFGLAFKPTSPVTFNVECWCFTRPKKCIFSHFQSNISFNPNILCTIYKVCSTDTFTNSERKSGYNSTDVVQIMHNMPFKTAAQFLDKQVIPGIIFMSTLSSSDIQMVIIAWHCKTFSGSNISSIWTIKTNRALYI